MSWRALGRCILKKVGEPGMAGVERGSRVPEGGPLVPGGRRRVRASWGRSAPIPSHLRRVGGPNQSLGTLPIEKSGRAGHSLLQLRHAPARTLGCLCAGLQVCLCSPWPPAVPRLCHAGGGGWGGRGGGGPHLTAWVGGAEQEHPRKDLWFFTLLSSYLHMAQFCPQIRE